jgi:virulence factor Mce-like protein
MRQNPNASVVSSPIMIGAVTTLISVIAVFLSYNANSGLPFVPTYRITVQVPDAAGIVEGNDVREGGKRIGAVDRIHGQVGPNNPYAELELKLDKIVEPLRDDTRVTVRPRSTLGLKYLEVVPGESGKPLEEGATLPLGRANQTVELDQVFDTFDRATRAALQRTLRGLGTGVAGRGEEFNESLTRAPALAAHGERVARNLADPATELRRAVRALARVTDEVAPVAPQLGDAIANANRTLGALADVRPQLAEVLAEAPPTEAVATDALRTARPLMRDARLLLRDLKPGVRVLPRAATELHAALRRGIPVLRRARALAGRLDTALGAVEDLARDPATLSSLRRLRVALDAAYPTLRYVVPAQVRCHALSLWYRNASSALSEGDASGTFLRTLVILKPNQMLASDHVAEDLHFNPYPNAGGPGTGGECEAGNEPFLPGQQIGHVPGVQATSTESTRAVGNQP